jgi:hypothetical protein
MLHKQIIRNGVHPQLESLVLASSPRVFFVFIGLRSQYHIANSRFPNTYIWSEAWSINMYDSDIATSEPTLCPLSLATKLLEHA